jgi:DNA-binding GntR family transcriptional regulator
MVESLPRKGMAVKVFSDKEIVEVYDCRIALESMAVKAFTLHASKTDVEKLDTLFKPFTGVDEYDPKLYQKADSIFHDSIVRRSGNDFLYRLFQVGNLLHCIDVIGLVRPPEETIDEHLAIIDAISQKDTDEAEKLMRVHLERSKDIILDKMAKS